MLLQFTVMLQDTIDDLILHFACEFEDQIKVSKYEFNIVTGVMYVKYTVRMLLKNKSLAAWMIMSCC